MQGVLARLIRMHIGGRRSQHFVVKRDLNKIILFDGHDIPRMRLKIRDDHLNLCLFTYDGKVWANMDCKDGFWKESAIAKGEIKKLNDN